MTTKKTAATTAKVAGKKSQAKKLSDPVTQGAKSATKRGASPAPVQKKTKKEHKKKVVRDSYTMPQHEYQNIAVIKAICLKAGMHVKKSEVLRAGLKMLTELSAAQLKQALNSLEKIKTGRPQKN